jgi:hypothetical protein
VRLSLPGSDLIQRTRDAYRYAKDEAIGVTRYKQFKQRHNVSLVEL